jgi:hypothetical protein
VTVGGSTIDLDTPATGATTETFPVPSGVTVAPGATLNVAMNMIETKKNPPTLLGNVGTVYVTYTTPISSPTALVCKAK